MRYAEITISAGVVQNIIVVKDGESPPEAKSGCRYEPDDGTAIIGGTWDGAAFLSPPPQVLPTRADIAEADVRGNAALLAIARIATGNDLLTEDELVALVRGKLVS